MNTRSQGRRHPGGAKTLAWACVLTTVLGALTLIPTSATASTRTNAADHRRARRPHGGGYYAAKQVKSRIPRARSKKKFKKRPPRPVMGYRKAKVTIVFWGDFQCPFTHRLYKTLKKLLAQHPKKVKVVWADFPLAMHKQAKTAAIAGRSVFEQKGSKAFWKYLEAIVSKTTRFTQKDILDAVTSAGADSGKASRAMNQGTHSRHSRRLKKSIAKGKSKGVRGTPCMFINGKKLNGAQRLPRILKVVNSI